MLPDYTREIDQMVTAAHRAARDYRLMLCSSGNLSCRVSERHMLVTASRSWLADLTAAQVAIVDLETGDVLNDLTPSVETRIHRGALLKRPEMNVVLHFQSPAATVLACGPLEGIDFFVVPEIPYYIGPIGLVPYVDPGSPALADAVVPIMATHNLAVLRSHGMVTVNKTYDLALQNAVFFEMACQIILQGQGHVQPLTADAVARLRAASHV